MSSAAVCRVLCLLLLIAGLMPASGDDKGSDDDDGDGLLSNFYFSVLNFILIPVILAVRRIFSQSFL